MARHQVEMQRRHLEAIAVTLQELTRYAHNGATGPQVADQAVRLFADLGRRHNGAFKPDKFLRACTPGADVHARA